MPKSIVIIGTLDTKGDLFAYLKELIEERGLRTIVVDVGVLGHVPFKPTISRERVAEAGGTTIQELMKIKEHEPKSVMDEMAKGATKLVRELYDMGELDGVLSGGGSMGTALALEVFNSLPIGVPKLIVSTMAYSNAITPDMLSGADLMMLPLVAGLWGLNNMSKRSLKTAAGAIVGATEANDQFQISGGKTVGVTAMGGSVQGYMKDLKPSIEERGYEVAVFHGSGMSGRMFEKSIMDGFIASSIDLTVSSELLNYIVDGAFSAGKHRLEAAGKMGIPQIVCPSRLIFHWWSGSPLPEKYKDRVRFRHNALIGPVACSQEEAAEVAALMATKLNNAKGPTAVVVPLKLPPRQVVVGLFNQVVWEAFQDTFMKKIKPHIKVEVIDASMEDKLFVETILTLFDEMMTKQIDS